MRFDDHIARRGLTVADAARALGKHPERVRLWAKGETVPRRAEIVEIYRWSNGQVGPEDWYDLPDIDASATDAAAAP